MPDLTYRAVIATCRRLFSILGLRIEVSGAEHLPVQGAGVVAANHNSYADFMLVGLVGRIQGRFVRFMAKESVFKAGPAGTAMRAMNHIPCDRGRGTTAARTALRALEAGEVVGIYPEATIGRAFVVKDRADFRRGAAYLALAAAVPLVPVAHWGSHRVLTVGGRFSLRRGTVVRVVVGEPLEPLPGEDADALTTRLHAVLDELVEDLVDAYPQVPPTPAAAWWWPAHRGGGAPTRAVARGLDDDAVREAFGSR